MNSLLPVQGTSATVSALDQECAMQVVDLLNERHGNICTHEVGPLVFLADLFWSAQCLEILCQCECLCVW